jgi:hypothetical protein
MYESLAVLSRKHRPKSSWSEALDLTTHVLRRAQCPPDILGDVAGTLTAHKAERKRARKDAAKKPRT